MAEHRNIPYGRQYITDEDVAAVVETLRSDYLTQGPKIAEFEQKFASYVGAEYAVAVNNATSGLHIAAMAMGVKPGTRVIVTPITFASSANCIRFCGGEVEFCDIDKDTFLMDPELLRKKLESAPKGRYQGVVVVDFAGYPQNLEQIRAIADEYGLWIIEDACHAPGGYFTDSRGVCQRCGNGVYADAAVFSFHPVKHIATGEGGMVTTRSREVYDALCLYRTHGITKRADLMEKCDGGWYYEMIDLGYNYRLTDFQAALGISQLSRSDEGLRRRNSIARRYDEAFRDVPSIRVPKVAPGVYHAWHLYVIQVPDRKGLYDFLRSCGIFSQVHYIPLNTMPYYRAHGSSAEDCPVAGEYYSHCLSLPMYPTLSEQDQEYVISKVLEYETSRSDSRKGGK